MQFNYYKFADLEQWFAEWGNRVKLKPPYRTCAGCGNHALIKGYLGTSHNVFQTAMLDKGPGESTPAVFCGPCFDKRAADPTSGLCPVCGEHITLTGRTTDRRLIGSCNDAFTEEQWFEVVPLDSRGYP